jgi:hypothetical protein
MMYNVSNSVTHESVLDMKVVQLDKGNAWFLLRKDDIRYVCVL